MKCFGSWLVDGTVVNDWNLCPTQTRILTIMDFKKSLHPRFYFTPKSKTTLFHMSRVIPNVTFGIG